jgi:hypothetical protein
MNQFLGLVCPGTLALHGLIRLRRFQARPMIDRQWQPAEGP